MSDNKHWIMKLVPALAFAAGIIMSSIGGMMVLSAGSKLALFDHGPYNSISREQCEINYNIPIDISLEKENTEKILPQKRTEEEIQRCLADKRAEEKIRYQDDKKQNIVDGISALIIGGILILSFRRKK